MPRRATTHVHVSEFLLGGLARTTRAGRPKRV
jgi:hypothetical protein